MNQRMLSSLAAGGLALLPVIANADVLNLDRAYAEGEARIEKVAVDGAAPWGTDKTVVSSPHVIAGVFKKMGDGDADTKGLGKDIRWSFPKNRFASSIGDNYDKLTAEISALKDYYKDKFEALEKSGEPTKLNEWFAQNGFGIKLGAMPKGSIASGAILKIPVEWAIAGTTIEKFELAGGKGAVPGAYLKKGVSIFKTADGQFVAQLATKKEGQRVFMTRYSGPVEEDSATFAIDLAQKIASTMKPNWDSHTGVQFPKTKYDKKGPVPQLIGATTMSDSGQEYKIVQFQLQQRLLINHKGARAEAAAGGGAVVTSVPRVFPPLVINGPFLVWFEVNGVTAFAAVVSREHMEDPGDFPTQ
ncbi:MAG: hypothetical protein HY078_17120 [Elusimicrobia bacterium]|nr:hypothetical protein [Elusimicrobiota bacterium]